MRKHLECAIIKNKASAGYAMYLALAFFFAGEKRFGMLAFGPSEWEATQENKRFKANLKK